MRILGIDCGTERTGFGVIDTDGRRHHLVDAGVIQTSPKASLESRLAVIARELREVISRLAPQHGAIEEVFYSQNVKTTLKAGARAGRGDAGAGRGGALNWANTRRWK